jgi:hypothetical protein
MYMLYVYVPGTRNALYDYRIVYRMCRKLPTHSTLHRLIAANLLLLVCSSLALILVPPPTQTSLIMHTVWVRLNAVVFFGLSVLLGLSCLAAISKIGHASRHQPGETSRLVASSATTFCSTFSLSLLLFYSKHIYV